MTREELIEKAREFMAEHADFEQYNQRVIELATDFALSIQPPRVTEEPPCAYCSPAKPKQVTEAITKERVLKVVGWLREHNRFDTMHDSYTAIEWLSLASHIAKELTTPTGEKGDGNE